MKTKCDDLKSYAILDGTEWGEAMMALCHLSYYSHLLSQELSSALQKEISDNLAYVKANATIVESLETHTTKYKSLEWNE
jgi:hypothetical protein